MAFTIDKPCIIIGGGGHARVLVDGLKILGAKIIGCTDHARAKGEDVLGGFLILGGDDVIPAYDPSSVLLVNGIGSVKDTGARTDIYKQFKGKGYIFATLVHPAAFVSPFATIGEGSVVLAGAVIGTNARIGNNVIINTKASVDHDCMIGDHTHIAPGVTLSGGVDVGQGCHIGTGASVIQNVSLKDRSFIAAGEVFRG